MWPKNWTFSLPTWAVSNSLQKRLVKFLLRRTVGQFLKTELDDENLDVQLSGGQLRLKNALNDAISGLPLMVSSGTIGLISVSVPWTQLWTGHCELQIDDLVVKTRLLDDSYFMESMDSKEDGGSGDATDRQRTNRAHLAESVVMTDGGASILASSVFIADDFLRAETLGYGSKDEAFINKDVERMVANAHEETNQYYRLRSKRATGVKASSGNRRDQQTHTSGTDGNSDSDELADCIDDIPLPPGSPGGSMRGLQVVSEMVDRIISAVNVCVRNISVECLVATCNENTGEPSDSAIRLSVSSVDFIDDKNSTDRKSEFSTESNSPERQGSSDNVSGDSADLSSDRKHPAGIEYKVIEFRTLFKLLRISGIKVTLASESKHEEVPILSAFGLPVDAHMRIHRRMPFSELAPVPPKGLSSGSGGRRGRRSSVESSEPLYMGPMPGEFREVTPSSPPSQASATMAFAAHGASTMRVRNHLGEEATTSGWDVALEMPDLACVLTKDQLSMIMAIYKTLLPLLKMRSDRQEMRDLYQEKFGEHMPDMAAEVLPQLAKWVSVKLKHIYIAVVPYCTEILDGWENSSLAVLRLRLEKVKHLAVYLKEIGARWECTPTLGTRSAPSSSSAHVDTEFWASMTREVAARGAGLYTEHGQAGDEESGSAIKLNNSICSEGITTVTAFIQSVGVYDNDPSLHPVVRSLVSLDRSMNAFGDNSQSKEDQEHKHKHRHDLNQQQTPASRRAARNSEKYDIWMCASGSDSVLTVNVGPISTVLDKELVDRLGAYQELVDSILPATNKTQPYSGADDLFVNRAAALSNNDYDRDVADSIENLMRNLKISAEQKMPSKVALCSPLIRTWILLPGMLNGSSSTSKATASGSQAYSRSSKDSTLTPGHFCIDAIDAVITNVVNGTATSNKTQNDVPEGHLRHPHIQELLESRKSVSGSGIRVECESLHLYLQSMEGSSAIDHIACVHGPGNHLQSPFNESISVPRPHIEITTVAKSGRQTRDYDAAEQFARRPPAFDAFSAVDDNIRVRMAPESELSTSLKFERLAVALSRLVVSCHLPETEISLAKATYQRLNAIINDFLLWQSIEEEKRSAASEQPAEHFDNLASVSDNRPELGVSVLVDMPQMVARIDTTDMFSSASGRKGLGIPPSSSSAATGSTRQQNLHNRSESQQIRLSNTQMFMSNAIIEKGRMYVTVESNQVRLSSFVDQVEVGAVLSHTFATNESQMLTPQLSLYMLTSPSIAEESEVVLKTSWNTVDYQNDSTCLRDLQAFFSSAGTSGLVQPPPKPMRLSLNVQNSSLKWTPTSDPSISSAALSLDSLAVIVGINTSAPDEDREELHYYVEGLSVFGKSKDSLSSVAAVDVSSDAWVSTGRFWKDHGYSVLVHMDMVDVASRTKQGEDGPLIDLKLYSEALVLDACADSIGSLPVLFHDLIAGLGIKTKRDQKDAEESSASSSKKKKRVLSPQMLGQTTEDIFEEVEENTFALAAAAAVAAPPPPIDTAAVYSYSGCSRSLRSNAISSSTVDDYQNGFTNDFENGRDDISALVMDEYFAPHSPPDVTEEYEVVGGGKPLSPTSALQPMYLRRDHPQQPAQKSAAIPIHASPSKGKRVPSTWLAGKGQPVDIKMTKGKGKGKMVTSPINTDRGYHEHDPSHGRVSGRGRGASIGDRSSHSYSFGEDEDIDDFDLGEYVDMGSNGELLSEEEEEGEYMILNDGGRLPLLKSRFADQHFGVESSVVLEPEFPATSSPKRASRSSSGVVFPSTKILDDYPTAYSGRFQGGRDEPVRITAMPEQLQPQKSDAGVIVDDASKFEVIEDYFKEPVPGDTTDDDSGSGDEEGQSVVYLSLDLARVEVNLYSGQDWYVSAEQPVRSSPADPSGGYVASYMDSFNDTASVLMGMGEGPSDFVYGRVSASMPESRGPVDLRSSPLGSPRQSRNQPSRHPGRPARRCAKPKIELRATHLHAEFKQFSESSVKAYELGVNVGMLEVIDQIDTSEWSKFLTRRRDAKTGLPSTLYSLATTRNRELLTKGTADSDRVTSSHMRRQRSSRWPDSNSGPMVYVQVEAVRPYASLAAEELRVDFEISPLRCYIHQDALDFLIGFFESAERHSAMLSEFKQQLVRDKAGAANLDEGQGASEQRGRRLGAFGQRRSKGAEQPYFQIVHIAPINVIFDYKPRRMRTASGSGGGSIGGKAAAAAGSVASAGGAASPSLSAVGGTNVKASFGSGTTSNTAASASPTAAPTSSTRKPVELLNFFPLEDAEMTLNTVKVRGVAGISKLVRELGSAWLPHLTQTQIPGVVSGMTPLRSLVNIGSGVADLVILPLEQYRKDGRLVQGIKRGAQSFARTTALEAIQLGAKVAVNAQTLLEQAGDILNVDVNSAGESSSNPHSHDGRPESALLPYSPSDNAPHIVLDMADWPDYMSADGQAHVSGLAGAGTDHGTGSGARRSSFGRSKYARQPENLSEGMRQAYMSLRSNVGDAMQTILAIPVVVQEGESASVDNEDMLEGGPARSPVHGSVRAVVRAVPVAVLKPMIGATEAVSKTLLGLRNTMEPSRRGQLEDKYKSRSLGAKQSYPH
ncbi:autophagy- protein 2 [Coemansia asiatica]|uniref:Autophagy-related protein 2 n=1 Tax=Coemansia asiatica TaxID=1052880 RepID=A0A9W7XNJ8_9FUNG|nr:autophagy- protein 2 [Coemansia asiatica]